MKPIDYDLLLKQLSNVLRIAKKLGLSVAPNGGYAMSYGINKLPPYPVGLFGALSIVEGEGARGKLGLSFDETQAIEAGFNGRSNKKTQKKSKTYPELEAIGAELAKSFRSKSSIRGAFSFPDAAGGTLRTGTPVRATANRAMPEWADAEPIHPAVPEAMNPVTFARPAAEPVTWDTYNTYTMPYITTGTAGYANGAITLNAGMGGGTAYTAATINYAPDVTTLERAVRELQQQMIDQVVIPTNPMREIGTTDNWTELPVYPDGEDGDA